MILKCPDTAKHLEASLSDSKGKRRWEVGEDANLCSAFDSSRLGLALDPVPSRCWDQTHEQVTACQLSCSSSFRCHISPLSHNKIGGVCIFISKLVQSVYNLPRMTVSCPCIKHFVVLPLLLFNIYHDGHWKGNIWYRKGTCAISVLCCMSSSSGPVTAVPWLSLLSPVCQLMKANYVRLSRYKVGVLASWRHHLVFKVCPWGINSSEKAAEILILNLILDLLWCTIYDFLNNANQSCLSHLLVPLSSSKRIVFSCS